MAILHNGLIDKLKVKDLQFQKKMPHATQLGERKYFLGAFEILRGYGNLKNSLSSIIKQQKPVKKLFINIQRNTFQDEI